MSKIAVDFDGTCVKHKFPEIGEEIGAAPILKKLVEAGHHLILFTMRHGEYLDEAIKWYKNNEIPLHGIQTDPDQKKWTGSPKAYANLYIDDAALGIPLKFDPHRPSERGWVDWEKVEEILIEKNYL